jgi:type II secretory ATPase GspE/PulE/Tfp pilus assembly ATPase PilB-like protein
VAKALPGHLVLTTLHAGTSPGAVRRMLDIGLEPFLVNSALSGVVTQRLVRVLCPECRRVEAPVRHPAVAAFLAGRPDTVFHAAGGCEACRGTGYRGRAAIHEVLVPDDGVRRVVAAGGDAAGIRDAALRAGMRPLLRCALEKAALGVTSLSEVFRVLPPTAVEPGDGFV